MTPLRRLLWPVLALVATLLAACASPNRVPLGSSRDDTIARLGPPTAAGSRPDPYKIGQFINRLTHL
mgnify:CR=1 FL=1